MTKKKIINNIKIFWKGGKKMRFTKGLMLGTLLTAGAMMMYSEGIDNSKKKMVKKSKQFMKKIGL